MLWWIVDHATVFYLLFGLVVLIILARWHFNKRVVYLGYAAGMVGLIFLVWLLSRLIVTDRGQLEHNIRAMAAGVENGKPEEVFRYFAKDFRFADMKKEDFCARAARAIRTWRVQQVHLWDFDVEEVNRTKGTARVAFRVRTTFAGGEIHFALCRTQFRLEDDQWRLLGFQLFNPVTDTDQPLHIPLH